MKKINFKTIIFLIVVAVVSGLFVYFNEKTFSKVKNNFTNNFGTKTITFSGRYVCLPLKNNEKTEDCQFGAISDNGDYYAVNFGEDPNNLKSFMGGERLLAQGFIVSKESLSSSYWQKFNMKGIFTITKVLKDVKTQGKIDINFVCEHALTYMTFPDAKSADAFVESCKKGEEPNVIEDYIKKGGNMNNQLL